MRPKFKIWDKQNKCWYQPTYEAYRGQLEDLFITPAGELAMRKMIGSEVKIYHESTFIGRFEVVLFTGYYDKNNIAIYVGDLVKDHSTVHTVTWKNGCALEPFVSSCCPEHTEVIGNIYEKAE